MQFVLEGAREPSSALIHLGPWGGIVGPPGLPDSIAAGLRTYLRTLHGHPRCLM
jgi:hypothetical protein